MTEPVLARNNRGAQIEAMLRDVADVDTPVVARHAPRAREHSVADHVSHHLPTEINAHAVQHAGVSGASFVTLTLSALAQVVNDADARGEATRMQMQHDRMRGALAVLEGRAGAPEVVAEMARNPSFADGVHRAENLARTKTPAELRAMVGLVRQSGHDGQAAVCLGRDRGAAFDERYRTDPAFAHGVDFARRQRSEDPAEFATRRAHFEALDRQSRFAVSNTPIRM